MGAREIAEAPETAAAAKPKVEEGQPRAIFIKNTFINQTLRFPDKTTYKFNATKVEITDKKLIDNIRKVAKKYHVIEFTEEE